MTEKEENPFHHLIHPAEDFEEEEEEIPDDMRFHVVGSMISELDREYDISIAVKKEYRSTFIRIDQTTSILTWSLLLIIFITKPAWCENLLDNINDNCTVDSKGTVYHLSFLPTIDADYIYWPTAIVMCTVAMFQGIKMKMSSRESIKVRFAIQIIIALSVVIITICSVTFLYIPIRIAGVIMKAITLVFVISNNTPICQCLVRLLRLVWATLQSTILYLINFVFFTLLCRSLFYNYDFVKSDYNGGADFSTTRFDRFQYAFFSLVIHSTGENFPSIQYNFVKGGNFEGLLIILFFFIFTSIIIVSVLTGDFATKFDEFYIEMTDQIIEKDPCYKRLIGVCLRPSVLKRSEVCENFEIYHERGIEFLKEYRTVEIEEAIEGTLSSIL